MAPTAYWSPTTARLGRDRPTQVLDDGQRLTGRLHDPHVAFLQLHACPTAGRWIGNEIVQQDVGHITVRAEHCRLTGHGGQEPDGIVATSLSQLVDGFDAEPEGLSQRLHRLTAPDEWAGKNALRPIAGKYRDEGFSPGPAPSGQGPHPVIALVGAPSPGMSVANDKEGHDHDAATTRGRSSPPFGCG
jgi:hypothetical protein